MNKRRVVITGLGTINGVGKNVEETWEGLLNGRSGVDIITNFDPEEFPCKIASEVKNYNPKDYFKAKDAKKIDKYAQFGIIAADEAMQDSGLQEGNFDPERAGVIFGAGIGGMLTFEEEAVKLHKSGPRRISPFFIPKMISNICAGHIAIKYNLKAINFNITSACASANHAIGTAYRSILYGDADIIFAGGAEAAVTPLSVGGFSSMKALSTRNDDPKTASRPFDAERDGFVMGEGGGMLVLEELEHAVNRGARIYAELVGYGATCDAFHVTAPADNGEGGARAMAIAVKDAGIEPEKIDYINAHGTSTPLNDKNETSSIKTIFGEHARNLKISSSKSMTGHTLGAAAAIEAIVCCKTIETGKIHPTVNLFNPDPDCDLDYVSNGMEEKDVNYALSNSLGFGGHNGVIILKKYSQ
ncbi:MAG: beta-ketoacyl-[acyl-carrier-protein] synthase II [Candidatus Cloacimonadota bacterium]|nr:MAG: beta-ketoacyl-[acyl-carrier-protein] synthase II [Candidatus Cloacimonadota bacterium]